MRNNQKTKPISKSEKILRMCEFIGLKTFEDLQTFKKQEQRQDETTSQALERYFLELFEK